MADAIFSVMTVPAPPVSPAQAEAVARAHWGIDGRARLLTGERDSNFRLTARDGCQFVLKFANPAENPAVVDMQICALAHIAARDPAFPVPRMVALPDGRIETVVDGVRVRLLTWLPGIPLRDARRSAAQRVACGTALARLGLALRDFEHSASGTALIWDLAHTARLREVLDSLDRAARARVLPVLDAFEAQVAPHHATLRAQIVYNDMNIGNTLVDPAAPDHVAGIIDFGDIVKTALVNDVAIGATSQLVVGTDIPTSVADFVGGFHHTRALLADEIAVLPLLMACRLVMSVVLQAWHRATHPHNPHYHAVTDVEMNRRLAAIDAVRGADTMTAIRRACGRD